MRRIGSTPRPGSSCPAPPAEEPLEVLTAGNKERLDVHFPEGAEAEAAESMPVLCLTEQRLDRHRALPHRLVTWANCSSGSPRWVTLGDVPHAALTTPVSAHRAGTWLLVGGDNQASAAVDRHSGGYEIC
jgi:hypothetical protein